MLTVAVQLINHRPIGVFGVQDRKSLTSLKFEVICTMLSCGCERRIVCVQVVTRSSAIAEGPRDALCQLKSCQLPRNSAETTYTTSPDQIDGMKLAI